MIFVKQYKFKRIVSLLNKKIFLTEFSISKLLSLILILFVITNLLDFIFIEINFIEKDEEIDINFNYILILFFVSIFEELFFRYPLRLTLQSYTMVSILNILVFVLTLLPVFLLQPILLTVIIFFLKKRTNPKLLRIINFLILNILFIYFHFFTLDESLELRFDFLYLITLTIGSLILSKVRIDYSTIHSILFHLLWNTLTLLFAIFYTFV